VRLITSDAHGGIRSAITRHMQGTAWQRCQVHYKRQMAAKAPYKHRKELMDDLRAVLTPRQKNECLLRAEEMARKWEDRRYPAVARMLRRGRTWRIAWRCWACRRSTANGWRARTFWRAS
jgi:transposase-like protein